MELNFSFKVAKEHRFPDSHMPSYLCHVQCQSAHKTLGVDALWRPGHRATARQALNDACSQSYHGASLDPFLSGLLSHRIV